ncbi:hypothetical protein POVWA2_009680 [Plasmodium ovale wallikeri]|uniref:PIR Superfamily Protein n=1 Tax=Plasmodium ovale wallikeri TaxID=864142 RepID=A0A1A8YLP1_PLAOA|nr:hypothetical protein POVWA2_009680 [Plasmodium ovale wallikeri]
MLNSIHELNDKEFISNDYYNNVTYYEKEINHIVIKFNDTNTFLKSQNIDISTEDSSVAKNPTCILKELRDKSVHDQSHDFNIDIQRDPTHGNASTGDDHDNADNSNTYTPGIVSDVSGYCYYFFFFFVL